MSLHPQIITKSHADAGTVALIADLQRQVARLSAIQPTFPRSTSGVTTVAFSGTNSVSFTVTVAGATGHCQAIATPTSAGLAVLGCNYTDNNNGTVTILVFTVSGATITGVSANVAWVAWGT